MKKILLIILALSPFICLIGLGAGAISAYETAEKAALSILIKNKKDPAGSEKECKYTTDAKIFDKDTEKLRKDTEKLLKDKDYTNAVLAIYLLSDKKSEIKDIAKKINDLNDYAYKNDIIERNLVIQAYEYGKGYIDYFKEAKYKSHALEVSQRYYNKLMPDERKDFDFSFFINVLSRIDKQCSNVEIADTRLPLEKPFAITQDYGAPGASAAFDWHFGVDLVNLNNNGGYGAKVYAFTDAEVWQSYASCEPNGGYLGNWCGIIEGGGNQVVLKFERNGQTYYAAYWHMADIKVNTKDKVKAGQVIGTQGHSGNSTASHLHLEIRKEPPAWGKSSSDLVNPNHIIDLRSGIK